MSKLTQEQSQSLPQLPELDRSLSKLSSKVLHITTAPVDLLIETTIVGEVVLRLLATDDSMATIIDKTNASGNFVSDIGNGLVGAISVARR